MLVGAKVCELTDGFLWFVCGLYVGTLTSPLRSLGFCLFHFLISVILFSLILKFKILDFYKKEKTECKFSFYQFSIIVV